MRAAGVVDKHVKLLSANFFTRPSDKIFNTRGL